MKNLKFASTLMTVLIALMTLLAAPPASAVDIDKAYNGCVQFLKMPLSKQKLVVQRSGISMQKTLSSCRLLVRNGLKKDRAAESAYQRAASGSSVTTCSRGYCQSQRGVTTCSAGVCNGPDGMTTCSAGVCTGPSGMTTCSAGYCQGPRGVTTCSAGVCQGPDGAIVCGGGAACN